MKIMSWNVNGVRSALRENGKQIKQQIETMDLICLQETRLGSGKDAFPLSDLMNLNLYESRAERSGYSGVVTLSREPAIGIEVNTYNKELDREGRLQVLQFPRICVINAYLPTAFGNSFRRREYRAEWNDALINLVQKRQKQSPVILCGDMNGIDKSLDTHPEHSRSKVKEALFRREDDDLRHFGAIMVNHHPTRWTCWKDIDWKQAEHSLLIMQQKLCKAIFRKDQEYQELWRDRILAAREAKALAVRHVCHRLNCWQSDVPITESEKWDMTEELNLWIWESESCQFKEETDSKGKVRRIQLPGFRDRAMMKLLTYALDPIAEATGDRKSFAFRKGRSHLDADAYLREAMSGVGAPTYILKADVQAYYESIHHNWILHHIPLEEKMLRQFLKMGYYSDGSCFPTEEGIILGSSLSPKIGNMTLDGLQKYLYIRLYGSRPIQYAYGNMIRFADDIIVFARSREQAVSIRGYIADFLRQRGLRLHPKKTQIIRVTEGFDFLSHHYQVYDQMAYVRPADEAVERVVEELTQHILGWKGSARRLIKTLNQKLIGWATYHQTTQAEEAFWRIDEAVLTALLERSKSIHPDWDRAQVLGQNWMKDSAGRWRFVVAGHPDMKVVRLADRMVVEHRKVRTKWNPYLD